MKIEEPLVSVLICNYNYGQYLKEAINSALGQTYSHIEVIVIDDGSSDNSREVIANYKNKIISVLKENGGQASAFNAGWAISQGEIICLLDSDDKWLPQKVEQVVQIAHLFSNCSCIYHRIQNIDKVSNSFGKPWPPYKVIQGNISQKVVKTGGWWPFPPSTGLSFTRNFLSQVMNIPEEEYRICADTYLADLAPFFGDVIGIDQTLSLFRIHDSNNWSNPVNHQKRELQHHELRVKVLNRVLENSGFNMQVSLQDHLPYQRLKFRLGDSNFIRLNQLVWQNPWELRLISKLKATFNYWLEILKLWGKKAEY